MNRLTSKMRPETLLPCRWHVYRDPFMTAVLVSEGRTLIFALQSTSQGHQIKWHCLLQRVRENRKRGEKVPYIKYCLGSLRQIIRRVFDMPSQAWLVKGKKMYRCSQNSYSSSIQGLFCVWRETGTEREQVAVAHASDGPWREGTIIPDSSSASPTRDGNRENTW